MMDLDGGEDEDDDADGAFGRSDAGLAFFWV